jgi:hypothetical protein
MTPTRFRPPSAVSYLPHAGTRGSQSARGCPNNAQGRWTAPIGGPGPRAVPAGAAPPRAAAGTAHWAGTLSFGQAGPGACSAGRRGGTGGRSNTAPAAAAVTQSALRQRVLCRRHLRVGDPASTCQWRGHQGGAASGRAGGRSVGGRGGGASMGLPPWGACLGRSNLAPVLGGRVHQVGMTREPAGAFVTPAPPPHPLQPRSMHCSMLLVVLALLGAAVPPAPALATPPTRRTLVPPGMLGGCWAATAGTAAPPPPVGCRPRERVCVGRGASARLPGPHAACMH